MGPARPAEGVVDVCRAHDGERLAGVVGHELAAPSSRVGLGGRHRGTRPRAAPNTLGSTQYGWCY